jgi:hypothetical protein
MGHTRRPAQQEDVLWLQDGESWLEDIRQASVLVNGNKTTFGVLCT